MKRVKIAAIHESASNISEIDDSESMHDTSDEVNFDWDGTESDDH